MNTEVNFEIAKSLKGKGYPQLNTGLYYTKDKDHCLVGWGFNDRTEESLAQYSAPTISEVVMWLYEKHGIWIGVTKYKNHVTDVNDDCYFTPDNGRHIYKTPTEAYEARIKLILENVL